MSPFELYLNCNNPWNSVPKNLLQNNLHDSKTGGPKSIDIQLYSLCSHQNSIKLVYISCYLSTQYISHIRNGYLGYGSILQCHNGVIYFVYGTP